MTKNEWKLIHKALIAYNEKLRPWSDEGLACQLLISEVGGKV